MTKGVEDDKKAGANLLEAVKLDENLYRLGHTKARWLFHSVMDSIYVRLRRFLDDGDETNHVIDAAASQNSRVLVFSC